MSFDYTTFLEKAVQIESHENIAEMQDFLVEVLDEQGIDNYVDGANNVIATRGQGNPHIVLNSHIDTVPPQNDCIEFRRENGIIYGRGACDAKGPLAALLSAFLSVDVANGKVTLVVTPDEETSSNGVTSLNLDADACIVGEPTGLDVCNSSRGRFQGTVSIYGDNVHAAKPDEGINAIDAVCQVRRALDTFDDRLDTPGSHPELGSPTLTPTIIKGGDTANQVPDYCELIVDRRTVPPETSEEFQQKLSEHLQEHVSDEFSVEFCLDNRDTPFLEAFETPKENNLVQELQRASGGDIRPFGAVAEASYFAMDMPTVVFGPGKLEVAHSEREHVSIDKVGEAAKAVTDSVQTLLSQSQPQYKERVLGKAD